MSDPKDADPQTVVEAVESLHRLRRHVDMAIQLFAHGPWHPNDQNPREIFGFPAHMLVGDFVILDLTRLKPQNAAYNQQKCFQCGQLAVPQFTVTGPRFGPNANPNPRHFNCTGCFWKWVDAVIASRDTGGRLDQAVRFDPPYGRSTPSSP